jgi:hypothetical protein
VEPAGSETRQSELPVTRDTTQIEIKPAPEQFGGSRLRPNTVQLRGSGLLLVYASFWVEEAFVGSSFVGSGVGWSVDAGVSGGGG